MSVNLRTWLAVGFVTGLFVCACGARMNWLISLDPDGTDFLLLARSVATGNGYRDISEPDWPVHTFRPPGFPFLLTPAAMLAPYNIVAAKITVIIVAAIMLLALWRLGSLLLGQLTGFVVFLIVATSPATHWYATDVLSEIPYTTCTLGATLLGAMFARSDQLGTENSPRSYNKLNLAALYALIAFAPLVRLVGLSFTGAAIVAALLYKSPESTGATVDHARWKRVLFALTMFLPILLWCGRNAVIKDGTGYASSFGSPRAGGPVAWTVGSLSFYADAVTAYALSTAPRFMGVLLALIPAVGMLLERRRVGIFALVYYVVFFAVLAAYPYRHPRLAWPLVPFALMWSARAVQWGMDRLGESPRIRWVGQLVVLVVVGVWITYQTTVCVNWAASDLRLMRNPRLRWADLPPPEVRQDWRSAGTWLRGNTPAYARVLTRDKSLFVWSRRAQFSTRFEALSAQAFQRAIQDARATYLALPYWGHGASIPLERLTRDPVYRFERVYDAGGVLIYRVAINRTGTVPGGAVDYSSILKDLESGESDSVAGSSTEFLRGHFLRRSGRASEAVALLRGLVGEKTQDVSVVLELATSLIDMGELEEAVTWYHRAEQMAGADLYKGSIATGMDVARQLVRFHDAKLPAAERADAGLEIALRHLQMGRYESALKQLRDCLEIAPSSASCWYFKALVLQRLGHNAEAVEAYTRAWEGGMREAYPKLLLLQTAQALNSEEPVELTAGEWRFVVDPRTSEAYLNLATLALRDGIPGFAMGTLERARERFPDDAAVLQRLGELYEFYGEWSLAEATWSRAEEIQPDLATFARLARLRKQMAAHPAP